MADVNRTDERTGARIEETNETHETNVPSTTAYPRNGTGKRAAWWKIRRQIIENTGLQADMGTIVADQPSLSLPNKLDRTVLLEGGLAEQVNTKETLNEGPEKWRNIGYDFEGSLSN